MNKTTELFIAYKNEFEKSSLRNNELIEFSIPFTYSDLRNITNGTIYLKSCNKKISIKESIEKLENAIKNNNKLRVWSSHVDPDYYLFLLFICYYVKDKVDFIEVLYSDEYNNECINTGVMTSEELDELSSLEHKLDKNEINNLANKWNELTKDGSKLHIFKNNKLIEIEYEYIYKEIINIIKEYEKISIVEIVLILLKKYRIFTEYLIENLIKEKRIQFIQEDKIFSKCIVGLN